MACPNNQGWIQEAKRILIVIRHESNSLESVALAPRFPLRVRTKPTNPEEVYPLHRVTATSRREDIHVEDANDPGIPILWGIRTLLLRQDHDVAMRSAWIHRVLVPPNVIRRVVDSEYLVFEQSISVNGNGPAVVVGVLSLVRVPRLASESFQKVVFQFLGEILH